VKDNGANPTFYDDRDDSDYADATDYSDYDVHRDYGAHRDVQCLLYWLFRTSRAQPLC